MVEEHHCGAYVDPENPRDFFDLLLSWKSNPALLAVMGQNARKLAEEKYDKSFLTKQFSKIVTSLNIRRK
jgi:glycosyltransferase involved in cell wall biosynthesis